MTQPPRTPYDEVPYPTGAFPQTHPDRLHTLAALHGMKPAPVERCRVLEIGCGEGRNLLAMAVLLPHSTFVGVDLAASALAHGRGLAESVGVRNLDFRHMNILDITPEFGEFDYIIAHGVFSWIPATVREKLLSVFRHNLAPQGVAYVSYHVYPGFHFRAAIRDMIRYHTRDMESPQRRVSESRGLIRFLLEVQPQKSPDARNDYAVFLDSQLKALIERDDAALLHDLLADINDGFYFREFMQMASSHELQYLSEAFFADTQIGAFSEAAALRMGTWLSGQRIEFEQYMDFIKGRVFRQTLLCHRNVSLCDVPAAADFRRFRIAGPLMPESPQPNLAPGHEERFTGPDKAWLTSPHPAPKAGALAVGQAWPQSLSFDEFQVHVRRVLDAHNLSDVPLDERMAEQVWCEFYRVGVAQLRSWQPPVAARVPERPAASALARHEVQISPCVTTLAHTAARLEDPPSRLLVQLLDGTRDLSALARDLEAALAEQGHAGKFDITEEKIAANLERLRRIPLLIA